MRKLISILISLICLYSIMESASGFYPDSAGSIPARGTIVVTNTPEETTVLRILNAMREAEGLTRLKPSATLRRAASYMALDLSKKRNDFSHVDTLGHGPYARAVALGMSPSQGAGEVLLIGIESPVHALLGWWASNRHRPVIMHPAWKYYGITRVHNEDNPWEWFWVLTFSTGL